MKRRDDKGVLYERWYTPKPRVNAKKADATTCSRLAERICQMRCRNPGEPPQTCTNINKSTAFEKRLSRTAFQRIRSNSGDRWQKKVRETSRKLGMFVGLTYVWSIITAIRIIMIHEPLFSMHPARALRKGPKNQ